MASPTSISLFNALLDTPPQTLSLAKDIRLFPTLDSTNTYALEHGSEGMLVIADQQSAGRGRLQRAWHSAPGMGLCFTVCLDGLVQGLTFAAALAVRDVLSPLCPITVKWPNDILLDGKKVCGILVEHKHDRMALGIGVNVHQQTSDFPEDLREIAASLDSLTEKSWDRVELLRNILERLDGYIARLAQGDLEGIRMEWIEACAIIGQPVQIGDIAGVVESVDEIGALMVKTSTGTERVLSGEIELQHGVNE